MKIKFIERYILIVFGLMLSIILNGQPNLGSTLNIGEIERKPCHTYLNFLGLNYRPQMLRKDTLIFDYKNEMIIFIQKKKKLNSARFINKNTNMDFSKCLLENGTGKLIIFRNFIIKADTTKYWLLNFVDGMLADTSFYIEAGEVKEKYVFENNDLRVVEKYDYSNRNIKTIHFHQEYLNGLEHGYHAWYGLLGESTFIVHFEWDKYDGKLYKDKLFDNGQLLEETIYKKNGEVKRKLKSKLHRVYPYIEKKECE